MNTEDLKEFVPKFIAKLEDDGLNSDTIETNKWILNFFERYCMDNNIAKVTIETIKKFCVDCYGFDINNYTL